MYLSYRTELDYLDIVRPKWAAPRPHRRPADGDVSLRIIDCIDVVSLSHNHLKLLRFGLIETSSSGFCLSDRGMFVKAMLEHCDAVNPKAIERCVVDGFVEHRLDNGE